MFGRRREAQTTITVIAAGSVIEGVLRVRGMVQVDGMIDGQLLAEGQVSIGPEGKVYGEVSADELSVAGAVEGTLWTRGHLHVLSSGSVRGNARYSSLQVDRGGIMDGSASLVEESEEAAVGDVELVADAAAE